MYFLRCWCILIKKRISKILPHTAGCVPEMQKMRSLLMEIQRVWLFYMHLDIHTLYVQLQWLLTEGPQMRSVLCKVRNPSVWRMTWCRMVVSEARAEAGEGGLSQCCSYLVSFHNMLPPLPHTFQILHQTGEVLPTLWNLCSPVMLQCIVPSTEDGKYSMGIWWDQE